MDQPILYFYEFVEKMSFVFAFGFAIIYISVSLVLFEDRMTNKESTFLYYCGNLICYLFVLRIFYELFTN